MRQPCAGRAAAPEFPPDLDCGPSPEPPGARGRARTTVGEGLFDLGDADGIGPRAVRPLRPPGVAWDEGTLHVVDTYNHGIERLDPRTGECRTSAGRGEPGYRDGPSAAALPSEPGGPGPGTGRERTG